MCAVHLKNKYILFDDTKYIYFLILNLSWYIS